jgi:hypothetical protein
MRRASLATLTLAGAAGIHAATAQELVDSTLTATISQSLEADSNFDLDDPSPGTSYFGDTRIGLAYLHATPTQVFELGLDTGLRGLSQPDEDFEWTFASPSTASLGYANEWASGNFGADVRYRQTQVDFNRPLSDFATDEGIIITPDDLNQLQGDAIERRTDANFVLALATDAPSSYEFTLSATNIDYSEDTADQTPRTVLDGNALWTLRLTPVLSSAVLGSYYLYQAHTGDETEVRIGEIDAGVVYEPDENVYIAAGLGYAHRVREETIGGDRETTQDEQGPSARALVRYTTENLTLNFNGRVTTAAPTTRFNGALGAVYRLPRGNLNARVFQRYIGNSSDQEVSVTGVGLGLIRNINNVSRIGLDFAYGLQVNQDDPNDPDIHRTDFTARYIHDVTETVGVEVGYRFRNRIEDPQDATSNAVFLVIGKSFETGL